MFYFIFDYLDFLSFICYLISFNWVLLCEGEFLKKEREGKSKGIKEWEEIRCFLKKDEREKCWNMSQIPN